MAAKEHDDDATAPEENKKSGKMLLIIISVVLVLILVIGGVIAMMMMGNHDAEGESSSASHKEAPAHADEEQGDGGHAPSTASHGGTPTVEVGIMYPLDLFTVNLLSESGRRYLKVEMNLELEGEELAMELDTKKPVLRDVIIRILSSKSLEEVSTVKGKESLKEQIVSELNMRIKDGKINNVYFTDFVVQ